MGKTKTRKRKSEPKQIGVNDFKNLVKQCKALKQRGAKATSEMGGLISNAAEHKNLDKTAFSIFRRLEAMDDTLKLGTTLACLRFYIDIGGLDERVADAPVLDIEREETDDKVVRLPTAAE